jgi:hypothetical protein
MTAQERILEFLKHSAPADGLTRRELVGVSGLGFNEVQAALDALVTSGDVLASEGEPNLRRYRSPEAVPLLPPPAPIVDRRNPEQIWSDAAQRKHQEEIAAAQPKPTPRYEPTPEQVAEELAKPKAVRPLTPEEHAEYERLTRNRVARNPQSFLVK